MDPRNRVDRRRGVLSIHPRRYLSGRVLESLKLLVVGFVGQGCGAAVAAVGLLPAAVVGAALYFFVGLIPALVAAGVLAIPVVVAAAGATGAFRSAVWTLGYLQGRAVEVA